MGDEMLRLSVIVPVHNGLGTVERCLDAIRAGDLPPHEFEVIAVDDGSTDGTGDVVRPLVDRVVCLDDGPTGPARARNAGVTASRGGIVAFVDADVIVHADALRRCVEVLEASEDVGAVFGAYDDRPEAQGLASRYRNLLHRYVHLRGAGPADTFWAGLGAVRREAFLSVDGFDASRFPRPQIEDIELGYRLRDAGWGIVLDPAIQGTHLKRWGLRDIIRTDVRDRGIPWMRLLLERRERGLGQSLNVGGMEKAKTVAAGAVMPTLGAAPVVGAAAWAVGGGLVLLLVLWNLPFYRWLARKGGVPLALGAVPLHLMYYLLNALSAGAAWLLHRVGTPQSPRSAAGTIQGSGSTVPDAPSASRREVGQ